jgi:hypothetical protein
MYVWYLSFLLLDLYLAIFYFVFSFVILFFYRYPLYVKHLIHFLFLLLSLGSTPYTFDQRAGILLRLESAF